MTRFLALLLALCLPLCAAQGEEDEDISLLDILNQANQQVVSDTVLGTPTPEPPADATAAPAFPSPTPEAAPVSYTEPDGSVLLTITALGNISVGYDARSESDPFAAELERQGGNLGFFLQNMAPTLLQDDLTIANFSGTLTESTYLPSTLKEDHAIFRLPTSVAKNIKEGGIDLLSLANEHVQDHGSYAYADTLSALRRAEINYSITAARGCVEVKGVSICLLSYHVDEQEDVSFYTTLQNEIAAARAQSELVIVSFHWGDPNAYRPAEWQTLLGRFAVDAGADLVLGHHPVHIQPIEHYNGAYICYSLGNFARVTATKPDDMSSFALQFQVRCKDGNAAIEQLRLLPLRISSRTDRNDFIPTLQTQPNTVESIVTMLKENGAELTYALTEYPLKWSILTGY